MKISRICTLILAIFLFHPNASFANDNPSEGYWLTQNKRAVIKTQACDEGLCGSIYWIIDGGMTVDEKNPDASKRKNPLCGMKILWGFKKSENVWNNGKIYKADEGDIYSANIKQIDANTLELRGYVGIPLFGKTQTWTRVSEKDYKPCAKE